jgi:hypothetical protein
MIAGTIEPLDWYDVENCTIQLKIDDGEYAEVATVITDPENEDNWVIDDGNERLLGTYSFEVPFTPGSVCYLKYIDNSDGTYLVGDAFSIESLTTTTNNISCAIMVGI